MIDSFFFLTCLATGRAGQKKGKIFWNEMKNTIRQIRFF